ncbi:hypothetical protein IO90_16960 [Chryseobacterium sp. FH1]|nr:hypothetical protein IO90_16960 [Chryseobacterium sp. FH1]
MKSQKIEYCFIDKSLIEMEIPSPDWSGNPTASPSTGSGQAGLRGIATESRFPAHKNEKAQTNLSFCFISFWP